MKHDDRFRREQFYSRLADAMPDVPEGERQRIASMALRMATRWHHLCQKQSLSQREQSTIANMHERLTVALEVHGIVPMFYPAGTISLRITDYINIPTLQEDKR